MLKIKERGLLPFFKFQEVKPEKGCRDVNVSAADIGTNVCSLSGTSAIFLLREMATAQSTHEEAFYRSPHFTAQTRLVER